MGTLLKAVPLPMHLEDLATEQGGVFTAGQMTRLGLSRKAQTRLAHGGAIRRLGRDAYVLERVWGELRPWQHYGVRVRAIALRMNQDPVAASTALSHVSAALLWGLPLLSPASVVHVAGINGPSRISGGVHRHHADLEGVETIDGIRVTSLRHTVIDCCATLPFPDAVALADVALAKLATARRQETGAGLAIAQEIHREDLIDLLARRRPRSAGSARKALLFADARSGSPAESKARVLMHVQGLGPPELQFPLHTPHGNFFADFCFAGLGVLVEVDGRVKVADPFGGDPIRAIEAERRRHVHLQEQGWEITRLTWDDLSHPSVVRQKILAAATRARGRGIARG